MQVTFCALIPDQEAFEYVQQLKSKVMSLAGHQQYAEHFPHITLFTGSYKGVKDVELKEEILKNAMEIKGKIEGFLEFKNDSITGNNSLALKFDKNTEEQLRKVQTLFLKVMGKKKTVKIADRYQKVFTALPKKLQDSLLKYGYPFIGNDWIPHLTIASINPVNYTEVFSLLKKDFRKINFRINKIGFYTDDEHDHISVIKEWKID